MRVVGTRRRPEPGAPLPTGFSRLGGAGDLDAMLPESDFVIVCCQWTPETHHLFNRERFAAMKPGSVLVNVARGEIVDEAALVAELVSGRLRAGLDVFAHEPAVPAELLTLPNVVLTPHLGSATRQTREAMTRIVVDNVLAFERGDALLTPVTV
jgi:glyoxylate reductase